MNNRVSSVIVIDMDLKRWRGKNALVTGASSGIGAAIAKALISSGINVMALDLREVTMPEITVDGEIGSEIGKFGWMKIDVSSEGQIARAFERMQSEFGEVDILVNNAGVIDYGRIIDSDRSTFEKLLNVNVLAVATCTREAVRSMRRSRTEGHIFNINSLLGHEIPESPISDEPGQSGYNLYPTTKHATVAMTHSLRRELAGEKLPIRITSISPGLVKTNIARSAGIPNLFDEIPALMPEDIADGLLYALGTRPEVQVTEITIRRTGEP